MKKTFIPTEYELLCVANGATYVDEGWMLEIPGQSGMIRAKYATKQLKVNDNEGLYRFSDWLPISRVLDGASTPITYKSEKLAEVLGLKNLYITFNGWWPERDAKMRTCSFKETEAYAVCGRWTESMQKKVLVVSSAGNTARAFAQVCSENNIPLLITIPEDNLDALWFTKPLNPCVKVIATRKGSDYFDAINLGNIVCELDEFVAEGGAKNIARRDGMGTTMLSAATTIGRTPDYYFQAVGSGTGAIAVWEACMRLIADGRFGTKTTQLMCSQNKPFVPMYEAWQKDSRTLFDYDTTQARKDAGTIIAKVLSNRKPPYSLQGGLYDAMKATDGKFYAVSNEEALKAMELFEATEGIDIHPAAGVALASLQQAVKNNEVEKESVVMLNVTGGGEKRLKQENNIFFLQANQIFDVDSDKHFIQDYVKNLFF